MFFSKRGSLSTNPIISFMQNFRVPVAGFLKEQPVWQTEVRKTLKSEPFRSDENISFRL
jgi:hypothetical protein